MLYNAALILNLLISCLFYGLFFDIAISSTGTASVVACVLGIGWAFVIGQQLAGLVSSLRGAR